jgi:hypothetical protein
VPDDLSAISRGIQELGCVFPVGSVNTARQAEMAGKSGNDLGLRALSRRRRDHASFGSAKHPGAGSRLAAVKAGDLKLVVTLDPDAANPLNWSQRLIVLI